MLEVRNVSVSFRKENEDGAGRRMHVLEDISFSLGEGACLGILGESGSGKSTLGRVLSGMLKPDGGECFLEGRPLYRGRTRRSDRIGRFGIVFQDYATSVNPRFRVGDVIGEAVRLRCRKSNSSPGLRTEIPALLSRVGLEPRYAERFPHQLSGGQLQRVCIARALALEPKIILFDEAISSLDAHTQVQLMDLMNALRRERGLAYVFITHDISAAAYVCDSALFLENGRVAENRSMDELGLSSSPYVRRILSSVIDIDNA